ncbi:MAG: hypothetical protein HC817_13465 [Saprospiraceae bacterium]|nr:hypothetical protein [Saprospiraceae bacterium]
MGKRYADTRVFKKIEIDRETIRIAYIDFLPCQKYSLGTPTDSKNGQSERCLEYVTRSLMWDKNSKTIRPIYAESRTPVFATVEQDVTLKATPSVSGTLLRVINPSDKLQIIKHFDNLKMVMVKK